MKQFLTSAATATVWVCGMVFIAMKALELPAVLGSLWHMSAQIQYDPLFVAASMLATVVVTARLLDYLRQIQRQRQEIGT